MQLSYFPYLETTVTDAVGGTTILTASQAAAQDVAPLGNKKDVVQITIYNDGPSSIWIHSGDAPPGVILAEKGWGGKIGIPSGQHMDFIRNSQQDIPLNGIIAICKAGESSDVQVIRG